ncbi:MAG: endolytic transglycosylase MltG [Oscillospiraceae bacterium]|nr:endolytic transglycosylase MltG [Oscillospiraceae bacterium]
MENNQFPEQEENGLVPQELTDLPPVPAEPAPEPAPEVTEEPLAEEIPAQEVPAEEIPALEIPAEELPVEEAPAEEPPAEDAAPIEEVAEAEAAPQEPAAEEIPLPVSDETMVDAATLQEIQNAVAQKLEAQAEAAPVLEPLDDNQNTVTLSEMPVLETDKAEPELLEELPPPPAVDQEYRDNGEEFQEMFNTPAQKADIPAHDRPTRKGRPKRKRGEFLFGLPSIAVTAIWLAIILTVGVTLGRMLWACASDVLAFGRQDRVVTVTIYQSDTIEDITEKLHKGGLIRYPGLFKLYASLAVDEGEIKPGVWDLNTLYDYHALVSMMSRGTIYEEVEVMIPEGYTCAQIFALLEENKVGTAKDLAEWAANGELNDYWFLEDVERGSENCLEGFLFPDTYKFFKNEDPRVTLQRFLDNFNVRFSEEMRGQIDTLNAELTAMMRADGKSEEFIAANQFTVRDVVNVASMIEKETSSNEESPSIASVIYNRLFSWGTTPAYLNIDATIIYALGGKTELTAEDLRVDSPYNTYTNTGMTPGPIANPGLASIKAALQPADTDYYFYVLDPATGSHKFSTTLDEHNAFIASLE